MIQENREIKSSVFADLFGDDELDGKRNFLSLYNAIHGTNLKLEETTIEYKKRFRRQSASLMIMISACL